MRKHQLTTLLAASLFLIGTAFAFFWGATATANNAPINIYFEKSLVEAGVWEGTVTGDVEGTLRTELKDVWVSGSIWHVEFDWIIDAGEFSFIAHLKGTLDTETGEVVMNGEVTEGWLLGANVHEEGQLVDPDTVSFEGTIQIMPETVD